eukprot:g15959.t1
MSKKSPGDFIKQVLGRPVIVKLNNGADYRGILTCLDGYMNLAMEKTEEYVDGELKHKYGDTFIRGNNVLYISQQPKNREVADLASSIFGSFVAVTGDAHQAKVAQERLMVPDDLVVGRMGGHNVVNHVANFHSWMLSTINSMTTNEPKDEEEQVVRARRRHQNLRVHVEALELTTPIDAEPLRKGMHAWLHSDSGQESEPFGFGHFGQLDVLLQSQRLWWYEPVLVAIAMLPSIVAIGIMPLDVWEKETLFADRRGKAQLEEVNVVTPKSSPIAAPRSELGAPRQGEAVSPSVSRTSTGLQGPARILLEDGLSSSPGLTLPGIEQRRSRMRSQSAPPKERPMVRRLENCCTEMRIGLENCQVVAHDREQLTIRNLRQQAAPPPEPPPPLPSGDAHEILWSGSPVGVSSGDGGGNPEGLGIWGEDKAEQLALQIAKSASSESEKRRRRFSCPKWGYASGLILGARLLELLLALSALSVLITSPAILGSATPISSGEGRSVEWRLEPSTWPALFRPSAALLRGPTLLVAAGPLLRSFGVSGGRWAPLGEPRLLPGAVLGLVSWEGQARCWR